MHHVCLEMLQNQRRYLRGFFIYYYIETDKNISLLHINLIKNGIGFLSIHYML